jgi:hypothetical protein
MMESDLVLRAIRTHGIKTRGMVLDVMPMARRLRKIAGFAKGLEGKCKKKGPKGK